MCARIHTTNPRKARQLWEKAGGHVDHVRNTGEFRWTRPFFVTSVRTNGRRNDVPAVILCRLNRLSWETASGMQD